MELFLQSPLYLFYAFLFGVIIGSFLNVCMYRFHTGRSLSGNSHCLSCQVQLRWYELFPLFSYVVLLGRCRNCGSFIPPRYFVVELATGLAFALSASFFDTFVWQIGSAVFLSVLICIVLYDLYHTIIPDELVIILVALACIPAFGAVFLTGNWFGFLGTIVAGCAAAGPFLFLWVISQGRWIGLGDAKLAFPLGLIVGLEHVFSLIVLAFWLGALVSLALIALHTVLQRGQLSLRIFGRPLTMKSEVPFAPFLILSFLLTQFTGVDVLSLLDYVL